VGTSLRKKQVDMAAIFSKIIKVLSPDSDSQKNHKETRFFETSLSMDCFLKNLHNDRHKVSHNPELVV
jgi:hypothetical protein